MFNKSRFSNENGIVLTVGQEDLHSNHLSKATAKYGVIVRLEPTNHDDFSYSFDYHIYLADNEVNPSQTYGDENVPPDFSKVVTTEPFADGTVTYHTYTGAIHHGKKSVKKHYLTYGNNINFDGYKLTMGDLTTLKKGWHLIEVNLPAVIKSDLYKNMANQPHFNYGNYAPAKSRFSRHYQSNNVTHY